MFPVFLSLYVSMEVYNGAFLGVFCSLLYSRLSNNSFSINICKLMLSL